MVEQWTLNPKVEGSTPSTPTNYPLHIVPPFGETPRDGGFRLDRASPAQTREISHKYSLYHFFDQKSIGKLHKLFARNLSHFCAICLLTSALVCGILIIVKGRGQAQRGRVLDTALGKNFSKFLEKPLDKLKNLCYNIDTETKGR